MKLGIVGVGCVVMTLVGAWSRTREIIPIVG
jgi:hypothetical protein